MGQGKVPGPQFLPPIMAIAYAFAYPFKVFAQCGIVISDVSLRSSMSIVFRVVQKYALPIISIVLLFGGLHYITTILYSITITNVVRITGYILILLIISGMQAASFTLAYINFAGDYSKEATPIQ